MKLSVFLFFLRSRRYEWPKFYMNVNYSGHLYRVKIYFYHTKYYLCFIHAETVHDWWWNIFIRKEIFMSIFRDCFGTVISLLRLCEVAQDEMTTRNYLREEFSLVTNYMIQSSRYFMDHSYQKKSPAKNYFSLWKRSYFWFGPVNAHRR
jgi:hypothetical protein